MLENMRFDIEKQLEMYKIVDIKDHTVIIKVQKVISKDAGEYRRKIMKIRVRYM